MKTVGIVAEYNPFHNGHIHQIHEIRRRFPDARMVVAMSGSFTQRGSVALLDKWSRAASAVRHGVSLVVELPTGFATRSAQYFAGGGVRLLDRLGVVDTLAFGAEYDDLSFLARMAKETDADQNAIALRKALRDGQSYAASLTENAAPSAAVRQPNVILAIEYLRALKRYDSNITPLPLPRFAAAHHDLALPVDTAASIASASAIRAALAKPDTRETAFRFLPSDTTVAANPERLANTARLFRPILALLFTVPPHELAAVAGVGEGLEYRLHQAALSARSYEELVESVCSKRYPKTRIQRLLAHLLLGLSEKNARLWADEGPLYIRPLAFNEQGRILLREIKTRSRLPIVTKPSRFLAQTPPSSPAHAMFSLDIRATALASLASDPVGFPAANADFLISPMYLPTSRA